jgi:hypothetical protein
MNDTPSEFDSSTLNTYRFLRGSMVVMVIMLAAAVIAQRISTSCWQSSISAYYFTSAHSIFIAALCALGVVLNAYRGSNDTEDILLDLVGILAFIVAMVPTGRPEKLCGTGLPTDYMVTQAIRNNIWAVIVALVAAKVISWILHRWKGTTKPVSDYGKKARWLFWSFVIAGGVTFFAFPEKFQNSGHSAAAMSLFAIIIVVVVINACLARHQDTRKSPNRRFYFIGYIVIACLMILTVFAVVSVHIIRTNWNYWELIAEAALIFEFAVFWALQTVELWGAKDRNSLIPVEVRPQLLRL